MIDILIYTESKSPKLQYVLDFISNQYESTRFVLVNALSNLEVSHSKISVNYSKTIQDNSVNILKSDYFENFDLNTNPIFVRELLFDNNKSNFDFFAATFFLLARVEEYRKYPMDQHGRFQSSSSLISKLDLLEFPIIDEWITTFESKIFELFKIKLNKKKPYKFTSTIDIDHIYAYRSKPIFVKMGSFMKDVVTLKFQRIKDRFLKVDPYDTFGYLTEINKNLGAKPKAFILTSERGQFDKSLHPSHSQFISKVKSLAEFFEIGIHPSYHAGSDSEKVANEKSNLEEVVHKKISESRQHFLRLTLPDTYRNLLKAGIRSDYSMGYADRVGFRAGTSNQFYWYDLETNQKTELIIYPFAIMDVTLKQYLKLSATKAERLSKQIIDNIRKVDGHFILIWHNSSFYNSEGWQGWKEIYEDILSYAKIN